MPDSYQGRDHIIAEIKSLSAKFDFKSASNCIANLLKSAESNIILEDLLRCGVIPEEFGHDSTEEKLYAKYCDILLAKSLDLIGFSTKVILERADAADVEAECEEFTLVGDAKAFRLSRTAKNQKDFKVVALNNWRKKKDYSILVCPIYQYPSTSSQIYKQAIDHNVSLLSYSHIYFLIKNAVSPKDLLSIMRIGAELSAANKSSKSSADYWKAVDSAIESIPNLATKDKVKDAHELEMAAVKIIADSEIIHISAKIDSYNTKTKEELIDLINSPLKSKILQIKKTISGA